MTIAFATPSLQRNYLPTPLTRHHSLYSSPESTGKRKHKSGLSLFGKLAQYWSLDRKKHKHHTWIPQEQQEQQHQRRFSLSSLFQSVCSINDGDAPSKDTWSLSDHRVSVGRLDKTFANDALYEKNRYRRQSLSQNTSDGPACTPSSDDVDSAQSDSTTHMPDSPVRIVCGQERCDRDRRPGILVKADTKTHQRSPSISPHPVLSLHSPPLPPNGDIRRTHQRHKSTSAVSTRPARLARPIICHARHYSHLSSDITVNSEDLTAKEFADIAGIKILPEDQDDPVRDTTSSQLSDKLDLVKCSSCTTTTTVTLEGDSSPATLLAGPSLSLACEDACGSLHRDGPVASKPNIWDDEFWRVPDMRGTRTHHQRNRHGHSLSCHSTPDMKKPSSPALDKRRSQISLGDLRHQDAAGLAIHQEARRLQGTCPNDELGQRNNYTIRKGRFEIHWEMGST